MTIKNRTSTCMAQGEKRFTATMRHAFTANEMRDTGTQANHLLSLFAYPVYSIPNVRLKPVSYTHLTLPTILRV